MSQPPPIHITGDPAADWIILAVGTLIALYWLRALRLAREGARRLLKNALLAFLTYFPAVALLPSAAHVTQSDAKVLALIIAFLVFAVRQGGKRSRYIPTAVKREVIARDLPEGGYDPKLHHIDHIYPHSRGGSNTSDNLRVIEKARNLEKGAKRPRMREMW